MKYLIFLPGQFIPPLVSLLFVYTFTRVLAPAEYGIYAVVASMVQLTTVALFSWLQLSVKRFHAEATENGWVGKLTLSIYAGYGVCATLVMGVFVLFIGITNPAEHLRSAYILGLGLALARAFSLITKSYRVGGLDGWRYSAMEASESLFGFLVALGLVALLGWGARGLIVGVTVGALMPTLIDFPALVARLRDAAWDESTVRKLLRFGAPFTIGYALEYVMSSSDRLLIQHFMGESAVGIYAVAYTLAERGISAPFQALALVSYPLLMRAMAVAGPDGARLQAQSNLELVLALAGPAYVGFVIASPQIAAVLIGPAFTAEAATIMPWIATGVFLACLRMHYLDHAFHLAQRTDLVFYTAIPPAILNVVLNLVLLPRIGLQGAVIAAVLAYALAIVINAAVVWRLFPMPLALPTMFKVLIATAVMASVLHLLSFSATPAGLVGLVLTGAVVYGLLALALDIGAIRVRLRRVIMQGPSPTPPGT